MLSVGALNVIAKIPPPQIKSGTAESALHNLQLAIMTSIYYVMLQVCDQAICLFLRETWKQGWTALVPFPPLFLTYNVPLVPACTLVFLSPLLSLSLSLPLFVCAVHA